MSNADTIQIGALRQRVESLELAIDDLKTRQPTIVPMQDLTPSPIDVVKPILAVVREEEGEFLASFVDANINASGESQLEAVETLKDFIASTFQIYLANEDILGAEPKRQLAVLRQFLRMR